MNPAMVDSVALFDDVPKRVRHQVSGWADECHVPAGETLIRQGDYAREFFVILDGTAEVVRDGKRIAQLGPGDFFGEIAMLNGPCRTASVTAVTDMQVLVVAPREFSTMLHEAPAIAEQVKGAAAARS
jgi:CRP-like cAMP-binding protein